jgi:hypothetical protein
MNNSPDLKRKFRQFLLEQEREALEAKKKKKKKK